MMVWIQMIGGLFIFHTALVWTIDKLDDLKAARLKRCSHSHNR